MATTVVKVVIVIMPALSMAMILVAFCKSAAITMVHSASRTFAIELAASTAFIHGVTATWAAAHAGTAGASTAVGRGGAATTTFAHMATTATTSASATTAATSASATTAAAFFRHKRYKSTAGRLCGTRYRRGVSRNQRCHCETARQGSRCEKFGTH